MAELVDNREIKHNFHEYFGVSSENSIFFHMGELRSFRLCFKQNFSVFAKENFTNLFRLSVPVVQFEPSRTSIQLKLLNWSDFKCHPTKKTVIVDLYIS